MKSRTHMQIAIVLAVVVVIIFVLLGLFGVGRSAAPAAAAKQPSLTGPQDLLKQIAAQGGVTQLEKYETVAGTGDGAKVGDKLTVQYTGVLPDGTVFDSSRARNEAFPLTLGVTPLIQGWTQGLVGAKKGERFILAIPPQLGYGDRGHGSTIPPNATLIFDIEIVDILPAQAGTPAPTAP